MVSNALSARRHEIQERRARRAQSGRLADFLRDPDDVVALRVADGGRGGRGALAEPGGGGVCCGDGGLGCPVTRGDCSNWHTADDFDDDVFGEDVVAQPECEGRESEVTGCERVVRRLSRGPGDGVEFGSVEAIGWVADVGPAGRVGEDVAAEWLAWCADLAWWTTPGVVIGLGLDVCDCGDRGGAGGEARADEGDGGGHGGDDAGEGDGGPGDGCDDAGKGCGDYWGGDGAGYDVGLGLDVSADVSLGSHVGLGSDVGFDLGLDGGRDDGGYHTRLSDGCYGACD